MFHLIVLVALTQGGVVGGGEVRRSDPSAVLEAGFARVDMDPPMGLSLQGYFEVRPADGVRDPVQINCVALSDRTRKAILFSLDLESVHGLMDDWRRRIARAVGTDPACVYIACTHTHTGPAVGPVESSFEITVPSSKDFDERLCGRLERAARSAVADLAPTTIAVARTSCQGISFIRRYRMRDGTVRTNPGVGNSNIVCAVGMPDETVQLVRFRRAKGDIALVNFQCHPDVIGEGNAYSADWPGFVRHRVESSRPGVNCMVFNGAQGDTNHIDVSPGGRRCGGYGHARMMGEKIGDAALSVWDEAESVPAGEIRGCVKEVVVPFRKTPTPGIRDACRTAGWLARVEDYRLAHLASKPDVWPVPVSTLTVGRSLAFAGLPGEPFAAIGREVKSRSPYRLTVFTCLTNGAFGYIPDENSYEGSSYESVSTVFNSISAHLLVESLVDLLRS